MRRGWSHRIRSLLRASMILLIVAPSVALADAGATLPVYEVERYYSVPQSQQADPPIRVGDILRFRWSGQLKPPSAAALLGPAEEGRNLAEAGWEVYAHPKDDQTSAFSVIPLKGGEMELPALGVKDADGRTLGVTRPMKFSVQGVGGAEESAKPVAPPQYLPPVAMSLPWPWWVALGGGALLLVLLTAWAVMRWMRRRRRSEAPPSVIEPVLTEDGLALDGLRKIEESRHALEGRFKPHYFGISEIVKRYAERRFGVDAAESTTREMLERLRSADLDSALVDRLKLLFEKLDRVKFTDHLPDSGEAGEVLVEARQWILATRRSG